MSLRYTLPTHIVMNPGKYAAAFARHRVNRRLRVAAAQAGGFDFPTQRVYGPIRYPGLRLVTCGGSFDRIHRRYRDNIVVYAR